MGAKSIFTAGPDQIRFATQANGDRIEIRGVHLGADDAAKLAELINTPDTTLEVKIKQSGDED